MAIAFNNVTYPAGYVGEDDGLPTNSISLDTVSGNPITVNGTVTKVGDPVMVTGTLPDAGDTGAPTGTSNTLYVTQYDNSGQILFANYNPNGPAPTNPYRYVFSNTPLTTGKTGKVTLASDPALVNGTSGDVYAPTCFTSGTLIRTTRGDVAVEDLRVGDLAVTSSGMARPITWIGQRTLDCTRHPHPFEVMPVRIVAHAFGHDRPGRDLVVSPGHSIAVDLLGEVLIPASALINGATVRQEQVQRVTYWHVELETHDLLVSENLPTESYLEMNNRGFFEGGPALALYAPPDAPAAATHADFCRPYVAAGPVVDFVRARLLERAAQLDWALTEAPLADLHLVVDGLRIEPDVRGLTARFLVPASARTVWLASDTAVPAEVGGAHDLRALGVCIGGLAIDDGFGEETTIAADDPRLDVGFHTAEPGPQRWTAGRALIPAELWAGCGTSFFLRVALARPALPRWTGSSADPASTDHASTGAAAPQRMALAG